MVRVMKPDLRRPLPAFDLSPRLSTHSPHSTTLIECSRLAGAGSTLHAITSATSPYSVHADSWLLAWLYFPGTL